MFCWDLGSDDENGEERRLEIYLKGRHNLTEITPVLLSKGVEE